MLRADEGRPVRLRLVLQEGRRAAALLPHAARRRRPRRSSSTATREAEGKAYFRIGGIDHSPDHRRLLWAYRRQGLGILHAACPRPRDRQGSCRHVPDTGGGGVWDACERRLLLHPRSTTTTGRRRSSTTRSARDAADDRLVYEESDPGFFMDVGGIAHQRLDLHLASTTTRPRNIALLRTDDPDGRAEAGGGARDRRCNTISRKAATSSSSSPMPTAPRISRS